MFFVIIVTCLLTMIFLIVASALYIISLLAEESDDHENADDLNMHTESFTTSPADQPSYRDLVCENPSHHHECMSKSESNHANKASANSLASENTIQQPEDHTESKEATSKEAGLSRVFGTSIANDHQANNKQSSHAPWSSLTLVQKNTVASQLGVPESSRQMFEEFDQKEMALGGSGLHWCKTRKVLDRIVKLGVPLDIFNDNKETALHVAARKRKLQIIIGLLCYGAEVNCKNKKGETPLIISSKLNDIFAVKLLLVFDSDVNATDNHGFTARHYVADFCDRHRIQTPLPSAAHLILAMLNEIGALRCADDGSATICNSTISCPDDRTQNQFRPTSSVPRCTDGCSYSGTYDGNSYNRWPDLEKESLYKRHMFTDLLSDLKKRKSRRNSNKQSIEEQSNDKDTLYSNILCIDGGGMRGIIVCQIMIEMEKYLKNPMISYFDWVGGTSVGAFLACALCNGTSLQQLRRVSFDVKDEVFSGNKPYNSKFLERVLKRTLGFKTRMSAIKDRKLAVPTVIADRDPCQLRFFRNYPAVNTILEKSGFSPKLFNNMSGHSVMVQKQSSSIEKTKKSTKTASKLSSNNNNRAIAAVKTNSIANKSVTQITTANGKSQIENNPAQSSNQSKVQKQHQQQLISRDDEFLDGEDDKAATKDSINESTIDYVIDENDQDPYLWQAVRASGAAPFFFKPYGPYLDGGIISNNPTLDILTEFHSYEKAKRFLQARRADLRIQDHSELEVINEKPCRARLVVSLGTGKGRVIGKQAIIDFGHVASGFSTVFSPVELIRSIRAARDLFRKLMQQSCHTEDHILDRAQAWCSSLNIPYFRINPPLTTIFSIDDKRDEQLINALWQTKLYMRQMRPQLEELRELLDGPQLEEESQTIVCEG